MHRGVLALVEDDAWSGFLRLVAGNVSAEWEQEDGLLEGCWLLPRPRRLRKRACHRFSFTARTTAETDFLLDFLRREIPQRLANAASQRLLALKSLAAPGPYLCKTNTSLHHIVL